MLLFFVLKALQGAFLEHCNAIETLSSRSFSSKSFSTQPLPSLKAHLVRLPTDLSQCDALIIPGGESTTMAIVARSSGLLEPLRNFVRTKPVWGTCAGAILLAESIVGAKRGGQEILGGISVTIGRNAFGSQVSLSPLLPRGATADQPFALKLAVMFQNDSFEGALEFEEGSGDTLHGDNQDFIGVFIRAPCKCFYWVTPSPYFSCGSSCRFRSSSNFTPPKVDRRFNL